MILVSTLKIKIRIAIWIKANDERTTLSPYLSPINPPKISPNAPTRVERPINRAAVAISKPLTSDKKGDKIKFIIPRVKDNIVINANIRNNTIEKSHFVDFCSFAEVSKIFKGSIRDSCLATRAQNPRATIVKGNDQ